MIEKKTSLIILIIVAIIALIMSLGSAYFKKQEGITCSSEMFLYTNSGSIEAFFTLRVINNKYGFATMKGFYSDKGGVKSPVRISKEFSVERHDDLYILHSDVNNFTDNNISAQSWASYFFPLFFYSEKKGGKYIIQLERLNDISWILRSSNTPILICEE
ncbi:hypothetical protein [Serratia fonticola]|uniref:hypothetical protein n=1 Tax=Serratia fonticola TaxID=47917 RepID=UPI001377F58E|nr:hypothetical protein [Serratia fonticola]NCG51964.1 hypothetical protein [Serratia fonticola]